MALPAVEALKIAERAIIMLMATYRPRTPGVVKQTAKSQIPAVVIPKAFSPGQRSSGAGGRPEGRPGVERRLCHRTMPMLLA